MSKECVMSTVNNENYVMQHQLNNITEREIFLTVLHSCKYIHNGITFSKASLLSNGYQGLFP
jgi:hypothetical protein